jgi:hypothetical protein
MELVLAGQSWIRLIAMLSQPDVEKKALAVTSRV